MFNLDNYVDAFIELAVREKDIKKRDQIVKAWVEIIKRHHRDLEGKKILSILESKLGELGEKAQVFVSDEKEQKAIANYFQKKNIPFESEVKPELLGGVKIIWDNLLIDSTISNQLDRLREKITGNK